MFSYCNSQFILLNMATSLASNATLLETVTGLGATLSCSGVRLPEPGKEFDWKQAGLYNLMSGAKYASQAYGAVKRYSDDAQNNPAAALALAPSVVIELSHNFSYMADLLERMNKMSRIREGYEKLDLRRIEQLSEPRIQEDLPLVLQNTGNESTRV